MIKYYCDRCKKPIKFKYEKFDWKNDPMLAKIDNSQNGKYYAGSIDEVTKRQYGNDPDTVHPCWNSLMLCEQCQTEMDNYCREFMGIKKK